MANRNNHSGSPAGLAASGDGDNVRHANLSSTQTLYREMFTAYGSTQPSTRDLYRQMFAIHGVPTPQPAVRVPEGMITMEGNERTQASAQKLYREMFATHGIATPHPATKQPQGMITLEGNTPSEASTEGLYRQMFATHGLPTPVTFQGSTSSPSSMPVLYHQMFAAHTDFPSSSRPSTQAAAQPRQRRRNTSTEARGQVKQGRDAIVPKGRRLGSRQGRNE